MGLPPRQEEFLRFVHGYSVQNGRGPSVREIGAAMGTTSTNAVGCQLQALRAKGLVTKPDLRSARSTVLTAAGLRAIGAACCRCSVCGCQCHKDAPWRPEALGEVAALVRNAQHGPADGEGMVSFAVRLQRMAQKIATP